MHDLIEVQGIGRDQGWQKPDFIRSDLEGFWFKLYKTLLDMFILDLFLNHQAFHGAGHMGGRIGLGRDVVGYIRLVARMDHQGASISGGERDVRSDSDIHYTSSIGRFFLSLRGKEVS